MRSLSNDFPTDQNRVVDCARWNTARLADAIFLEQYSESGRELGEKLTSVVKRDGKFTLNEARFLWSSLYDHYGDIEEELGGETELAKVGFLGRWNDSDLIIKIETIIQNDPGKLR